jgi:hypothetical protein
MSDLISSGSYVDTVTTKVGYIVTPTRVEYYGMTSAIATAGVQMDLVIPFSAYDEDDIVLIPEIANVKSNETFVDRVLKILGAVRPVDSRDDNADATVLNKDN